jgi:hypothetical protein
MQHAAVPTGHTTTGGLVLWTPCTRHNGGNELQSCTSTPLCSRLICAVSCDPTMGSSHKSPTSTTHGPSEPKTALPSSSSFEASPICVAMTSQRWREWWPTRGCNESHGRRPARAASEWPAWGCDESHGWRHDCARGCYLEQCLFLNLDDCGSEPNTA